MSEALGVAARGSELLEAARRAVEATLAQGADGAQVTVGGGRSTEYAMRDGQLETVRESASSSLSVRIFAGGRYSAHGTNDLRPESLERFLAQAVALTRVLEPDPHRRLPDPELCAGRDEVDLELYDAALESLERERCLGWLGELDEVSRGHERVISATSRLQFGQGRSAVASSAGLEGVQGGTSVWYGSLVTLQDEGHSRPAAGHYRGARHLEDLPPADEVAAISLQRALDRLGSRKGPSKRTVMVVDREAGTSLISRALGALSAASIQQKRSYLADRLGERVAAPLLTVRDEPLRVRGLGSQHYDGEGIAARPRTVIEEGVLRTYFVDTYYGSKLGWQPTTGGPSNLVLSLGERDLDAIVASVDDGFYVASWLGGNSDATTGDFSFGLRGRRIEGGRLTAPVGEMNVTGNYLELLAGLAEVGNDPHPCSSLLAPTLVFEGVEFSGR